MFKVFLLRAFVNTGGRADMLEQILSNSLPIFLRSNA